MPPHHEQMQSIQAMLAAGQRCVELERHSLLLWGLVGGGLCAFTDLAINDERFPDKMQHAIALLLWLAGWLGAMSWLDHRLTRRARLSRRETLPFAQAQVTRAWWMLLALGVLGSFAMFFHGGGTMVYALWTVLLGLGIFIFGLFSRPLVEWIGLAAILLGIAGLGSGLSMNGARWLTASTFAIGLPFAGWLTARIDDRGVGRRALAVALWLAVVLAPALVAARLLPVVRAPDGAATLNLPAGSVVPLYIDMDSALITIAPNAPLPLRVMRHTEIALGEGQPDGRYRFDGGPWHAMPDGALFLRIDLIRPQLSAGKPEIRLHGNFTYTGESQ
ncbi:MAG: hypothetical protein Q8M11_18670 [Sulfuritalea sp.]|nr:hypothetical protein [Sulfuritalea sp.]MDP1985528.1 hypothetical protein [Sulfuritalea sp.]